MLRSSQAKVYRYTFACELRNTLTPHKNLNLAIRVHRGTSMLNSLPWILRQWLTRDDTRLVGKSFFYGLWVTLILISLDILLQLNETYEYQILFYINYNKLWFKFFIYDIFQRSGALVIYTTCNIINAHPETPQLEYYKIICYKKLTLGPGTGEFSTRLDIAGTCTKLAAGIGGGCAGAGVGCVGADWVTREPSC